MLLKWLLPALATAVMLVTTVELGHLSARHTPVVPVRGDLFAPELGLPIVREAGAVPAPSTALTR